MNINKYFLLLLIVPLLAFSVAHKYYISVTQIDYIKEEQSVQITTRIFIDDFEKLLRERYDENITLSVKDEKKSINLYVERYLKEKIKIKINNKAVDFVFFGKDYDDDVMRCYLEIKGISKVDSFEIVNQVLFDLFEEQQNIIKTNINSKRKSYILLPSKKSVVLKFN